MTDRNKLTKENDIVAENVETAIAALENGEDVLLQKGDLIWLREILRERSVEPSARITVHTADGNARVFEYREPTPNPAAEVADVLRDPYESLPMERRCELADKLSVNRGEKHE
jgi:hypothetical protein